MIESTSHRFTISSSAAGEIELLSTARLPFEPTGSLRVMRDQLRDALRPLSAGNDEVLHATYASAEVGTFDVENVLLYNVGEKCLANAAHNGLRFERLFESPPGEGGYAHRHRYRLARRLDPFTHWSPGNELAEWSLIPAAGRLAAGEVWLAAKHGLVATTGAAPSSSTLGFRIQLSAPRPLNAAAVVKGVVDGVLCALHVHDGTAISEVAARLSLSLRVPEGEIAELLLDQSKACLGERRVLWPWGSSIQRNPADDRVVAGELLLDRGDWDLSGSLFEVHPTDRRPVDAPTVSPSLRTPHEERASHVLEFRDDDAGYRAWM